MLSDEGWCISCTLGEPCRKHEQGVITECPVDGCGRRVWSGDRCPTHYRHGREMRNSPVRGYGARECSECGGPHYAKGLCRRHYRARKTSSGV